jgi:hypothetical protein
MSGVALSPLYLAVTLEPKTLLFQLQSAQPSIRYLDTLLTKGFKNGISARTSA